jgi:hypothetical protein
MSIREAVSFINRARDELQASKPARAELLLELALEAIQEVPPWIVPVRNVTGDPLAAGAPVFASKPQPVQPELIASNTYSPKLSEPNPLHSVVKQYLRMWQIGHTFTYVDIAKWLQNANIGIALNKRPGPHNRPHWRKQLSNALSDLRRTGHLATGDKQTHNVIAKHP